MANGDVATETRAVAGNEPMAEKTAPIAVITAVSGFKLTSNLFGTRQATNVSPYANVCIGDLVKIPTPRSMAFGFIENLAFQSPSNGSGPGAATAEIQMLGELIAGTDGKPATFARGVSAYPTLGAPVLAASKEDIAVIYARPNTWTLPIGSLYQDPSRTTYLMSQEFLSKHSAILGTTGSGKSCALTLIVRSLLSAHPNGHVVMLDPHGEYAPAFGDLAECIRPETLQLPYWLLSFDELVEVLCSRDPLARTHEIPILKEVVVGAKKDFLGASEQVATLTVDTPVPYRLSAVLSRLSDAMGKLDRPDSSLPYLRLSTTLENLRRDRRYNFMFDGLAVRDNMTEILSRILRIPVENRPITILDISAVPSEIVNVVVSLMCRLIFDFALWSDRAEAIPILLVCDEAHRYIPRDESLGFEPTRRSIARIAKEGRKYGVSLCLVTQRPSEISETILSQCSTVFALRMNNEKDQNFVASVLPDSAAGLLSALPTLRQREAIVVGEGVAHPMRVRFAELDAKFRPKGEAANFPKAWEDDAKGREFLGTIVERWRRQ